MKKKEKIKYLRSQIDQLVLTNNELIKQRNEAVELIRKIEYTVGGSNPSIHNVFLYKEAMLDIIVKHPVRVDFEEPKEEWEPFDADKWTPDRVVRTIDGRGARVLCIDRKSEYPVVALTQQRDSEAVYVYTSKGETGYGLVPDKHDLMMLKLPSDKPHSS